MVGLTYVLVVPSATRSAWGAVEDTELFVESLEDFSRAILELKTCIYTLLFPPLVYRL